MSEVSNPFVEMFNDPERIQNYADGPTKFTPGFADLHRMVSVLMQERVSDGGHVLVHGAGGGLELQAFANAHPSWRFTGVDPAKAMLDAAEQRLGQLMARVSLHHGYIDDAPAGPFDAATSLLTLHFLDVAARVETVRKIVTRLASGAPFIAVHSSFPQIGSERELWMSRYEAYAVASGVDSEMAQGARQAVTAMDTMFESQQDVAILELAGLVNVREFYAAFTWRGWVGYVP